MAAAVIVGFKCNNPLVHMRSTLRLSVDSSIARILASSEGRISAAIADSDENIELAGFHPGFGQRIIVNRGDHAIEHAYAKTDALAADVFGREYINNCICN